MENVGAFKKKWIFFIDYKFEEQPSKKMTIMIKQFGLEKGLN